MNKKIKHSLYILSLLTLFLFPSLSQGEPQIMSKNVDYQEAVFAAGCFWCVEAAFDKVEGVIETTSGYTGGKVENPTYEQVSSGTTGHYEALKVKYDPKVVSYEKLLDYFWKNVDPLDPAGQFCDKGTQYLGVIFYADDLQKLHAENSLKSVEGFIKGVVATKILPLEEFYTAEDYHQGYYKKNPMRYEMYKMACGRDRRLKAVWEK